MALAHLRQGRIRHRSNNCVYFGILAREMLMFKLCEEFIKQVKLWKCNNTEYTDNGQIEPEVVDQVKVIVTICFTFGITMKTHLVRSKLS